jgi:CRP-like cAMP-binding protein
VTNLASKNLPRQRTDHPQKLDSTNFLAHRLVVDAPVFIPTTAEICEPSSMAVATGAMSCDIACSTCPAFDLLCGGTMRDGETGGEELRSVLPLAGSVHTIPARRLILHPKEWSEFVPIICSGWAMSSVALPDGRRQIISFLLPGDIVSAGSLLSPLSGQSVEAITEVTYRKFKRDEVKELLFGRSDLLEKLFALWNEAKARSDQLALDLGRRRAEERIARLILRLADKVAKRSMVRTQTFDFPLRQRHIADATGLTPVHVSKVLGELQRAGLIEINCRTLTILNGTELQRVADWR